MIHQMKCLRWLLAVVLLLSVYFKCQAGWVISETITDNYGNITFQSTFIQQNQVRFESASSISILNLNDSTLTIIFPTLRAYWHGTSNELVTGMFDAFDVQVQSIIVALPYDQQAVYQNMYDSIKQRMQHNDTISTTSRLDLVKSDSLRVINLFETRAYYLVKDSITKEELWVTKDIHPYAEVSIPLFIELNNQINLYSRKGYALNSLDYIALLKEGLIVKSKRFGGDNHFLETEVIEVRQIKIPTDFFYAPSNYRKVSMVEVFDLPEVDPEE